MFTLHYMHYIALQGSKKFKTRMSDYMMDILCGTRPSARQAGGLNGPTEGKLQWRSIIFAEQPEIQKQGLTQMV